MDNLAETKLQALSVASREDRTEVVGRDHVAVLVQERIPEMVTASMVGRATEFLEDLMRAPGADRAAERVAVQVGKMKPEPRRNQPAEPQAELPVDQEADLQMEQVVDLPADQVVELLAGLLVEPVKVRGRLTGVTLEWLKDRAIDPPVETALGTRTEPPTKVRYPAGLDRANSQKVGTSRSQECRSDNVRIASPRSQSRGATENPVDLREIPMAMARTHKALAVPVRDLAVNPVHRDYPIPVHHRLVFLTTKDLRRGHRTPAKDQAKRIMMMRTSLWSPKCSRGDAGDFANREPVLGLSGRFALTFQKIS